MVTRRSKDDVSTPTPLPSAAVAPVVKRKRRASCLGEQERRERKRAIDREAQRSLREKTKTHIAELERTIEILRKQDHNGATSELLTEIEGLRAENERLKDIIEGVKSVVGGILPGNTAHTPTNTAKPIAVGTEENTDNTGFHSPSRRRDSITNLHTEADSPPSPSSPNVTAPKQLTDTFEISPRIATITRTVDLDGMNLMSDHRLPNEPDTALDLSLTISEGENAVATIPRPDSPTTAAWAPFINEIFGPSWRCPSPIVLHIDNPPSQAGTPSTLCPIWRKSNELFGKVFSCRPSPSGAFLPLDYGAEAGMLYIGIQDGWDTFNEWLQSPVLRILQAVDQFLFVDAGKMDRLAAAYKSFKLLKYYLNPSEETLSKVPQWLRPSPSQSHTTHPIALDFFAWQPLRNRLVHQHSSIFRTSTLSEAYAKHLHFDWPFSFEDTFYLDDSMGAYVPTGLFERYHDDLSRWTVGEGFFRMGDGGLEEMRGDIESVGCEIKRE